MVYERAIPMVYERAASQPHPDVDLEKPAAGPAVLPGISSSTIGNMLSEAERNSVVTVPLKVARNQGDSPENVFHGADIECWKLGGRPLVNHGDTAPLHETVWGERYWLKCAEEHQRNLPVG